VDKDTNNRNFYMGREPIVWMWEYNGKSGEVLSYTRSNARREVKKALGLKQKQRLPIGVLIEKAGG